MLGSANCVSVAPIEGYFMINFFDNCTFMWVGHHGGLSIST